VLCLGPLLHFHRNLHVTAPRDLFAARPPALPVIRGVPQPRLYTRSYYFEPARKSPPVDASVYRVTRRAAGLSGYESLILGVHRYLNPPTAARWSVSGSYDWDILGFDTREFSALTARLEAAEGTADHVKLLRIGGVTHALALAPEPWWSGLVPLATYPSVFRDDMHLFKVPATLPRAYAVGGARAADGEAALRALTAETFDPRREIVLSGDASAAPTDPPGSVRVIEIGPDRARLEADLDRPGFIVLLEAYDPGWRATIDGRAAALLRANTIFRAVPAPAGHHIVECVYRPRAVMIGGAVSLTTVLLIGLFGALMARARRPASTRVNESMR
jgi:hypothetical protein